MSGLIKQAAVALRNEWNRQVGIRELSGLSDHQLTDIGLRREQLPLLGLSVAKTTQAIPPRKLVAEPICLPDFECCG